MINIDRKCPRCGRDAPIVAKDLPEASHAMAVEQAKTEMAKKLEEFFATLDPDAMPDFVGYSHGKLVIYESLCDTEGAKRSCAKRVSDLLNEADVFEARQKKKATEPSTGQE